MRLAVKGRVLISVYLRPKTTVIFVRPTRWHGATKRQCGYKRWDTNTVTNVGQKTFKENKNVKHPIRTHKGFCLFVCTRTLEGKRRLVLAYCINNKTILLYYNKQKHCATIFFLSRCKSTDLVFALAAWAQNILLRFCQKSENCHLSKERCA